MRPSWEVRLSATAERDFATITAWTRDRFGPDQARTYADTLASALAALADGPDILGCKPRDDIAAGIVTLHVARSGHKGRHFIIFRIARDAAKPTIEVLRLLHDGMDPRRHLPDD